MAPKIYRTTLILLLLSLIGISIYFIVDIFKVDTTGQYFLNVIALVVLIVFSIIEIFFLTKGFFKDDIIIRPIVYEGEKINKGPFIINNVLLVISLALVITLSTLCALKIGDKQYSFYVLISIFGLLLINDIYYDLYIVVKRTKDKDIYKLMK